MLAVRKHDDEIQANERRVQNRGNMMFVRTRKKTRFRSGSENIKKESAWSLRVRWSLDHD